MDILLMTSPLRISIIIQQADNVGQRENVEQHEHNEEPRNKIIQNELIVEESQEIALKRSQRVKRSAILNDYMVYLQALDFDIGTDQDRFHFQKL